MNGFKVGALVLVAAVGIITWQLALNNGDGYSEDPEAMEHEPESIGAVDAGMDAGDAMEMIEEEIPAEAGTAVEEGGQDGLLDEELPPDGYGVTDTEEPVMGDQVEEEPVQDSSLDYDSGIEDVTEAEGSYDQQPAEGEAAADAPGTP